MSVWQDLDLPPIFIGDEISVDNITLVPLSIKSDFQAETIVNAQEKEDLEILETESVNKLKIKAKKGKYFIPFLQVVGGGKQDRMLTRPYVVTIDQDPAQEIEIPVNCVEQGRWQYSRQSTGEQTSTKFKAMRGMRMSSTIGALNIGAEQHQTWSTIGYYSRARRYASDISPSMSYMEMATAEMNDDPRTQTSKKMSDEVKTKIKEAVSTIPDQTGVVLIIDNEIRVVELFGNNTIWQEQSEAIINSFISEIQLEAMQESKNEKLEKIDPKDSIQKTIKNLQFKLDKKDKYGSFYTYSKDKLSSLLFLKDKDFVEFYMANSKAGDHIINAYTNVAQEQFQTSIETAVEENQEPEEQRRIQKRKYSDDDFEYNSRYGFKKKR